MFAYGQGMRAGKAAFFISPSFKDTTPAVAASSEQKLAAEASFCTAGSHTAFAVPVQIACTQVPFQVALKDVAVGCVSEA